MKALGYTSNDSITNTGVIVEFDAPLPTLGEHDILVAVKAVSMNPVDTKVQTLFPTESNPKIMGYDCAGVVSQIGDKVTKFAVGDEVFYAGDITRAGTNAEYHAVDERIVGHKPNTLDFLHSAALPLTSITAWEVLFDALSISFERAQKDTPGKSILIIGGAGGVGSMLIQLVKALTGLRVITTASREETRTWVQQMGADTVIDHRQSLSEQLKEHGISVEYAACLTHTTQHFPEVVECMSPRGKIAIIDDPENIDITLAKKKSLSINWEFMFTRSMFKTLDMAKQGELLDAVAHLADEAKIVTTMTHHIGELSVENIIHAHTVQASGDAIGKQVLSGFDIHK